MKSKFEKIIYSMHPLEQKVLKFANLNSIDEIAVKSKLTPAEITTGLGLLEQKKLVTINAKEVAVITLDKYGLKYLNQDLPEIKLLKELSFGERKLSELKLEKEEIGSALGILKRNNLIEIRKEDEQILSAKKEAKDFIKDHVNPLNEFEEDINIDKLSKKQTELLNELKKRSGFVKEVKKKSFSYSLSKDAKEISKLLNEKYSNLKLIETISSDMLKSSSWKNKEFRHYDIQTPTNYDNIGRFHPMIEANNILKDIFVEMGFSEMTGPMVESAFWNMDTMWIPQDHPARDEQDTFYLEGQGEVPKDLMNKVKTMHEKGLKKSHTPLGEWSEMITKRRLLRTHSTATSFRTLYELGKQLKQGKDINGKYFYVANNFRNEAIDATHLAEFYQGEGFIIGDDLSLADLMGFIKEYYGKLGIEKIRFKPTFNPYTEPSMEAHYYDEKMKKWYALINSGIFRQETLEPMGLKNKTILAWGMGASRVAALLAKKDSMRDITGATCDFDWLKNREMMTRRIVR